MYGKWKPRNMRKKVYFSENNTSNISRLSINIFNIKMTVNNCSAIGFFKSHMTFYQDEWFSSICFLLKLQTEVRLFQSLNHQEDNLKVRLLIFTLKIPGSGGWVGIHPLVRRLPVISHRIMLRSQKLLTLSINIPSRRY